MSEYINVWVCESVCRVKTRSGVRVSGVENQDASRWRLSVDLNQKRQTSTVTAYSLRHNSSHSIDRYTVTFRASFGGTTLLQCVFDVRTRQRLRSASSSDLMVPRTIRSTIGERSFQSAATSTWNALPRSVRSSTSVLQFRSRLKTELLARSYQQSYWICLCVTVTQHFVPWSWSLWIYVTLTTILILTNWLTNHCISQSSVQFPVGICGINRPLPFSDRARVALVVWVYCVVLSYASSCGLFSLLFQLFRLSHSFTIMIMAVTIIKPIDSSNSKLLLSTVLPLLVCLFCGDWWL